MHAKLKTFVMGTGLLMALVLGALTTHPAAAHNVEPTNLTPAIGQVLAQSPDEVVLVFPEEAKEVGSSLQVVDAAGKAVDAGKGGVDLNDPKHVTLRVKLPKLAEGVYQVKWVIALSDGDTASGSYHFGVGSVAVPTEVPEATEAAAPVSAATPPGNASLPWLVGGLVVVLAVGGGLILLRRRR